MTHTNNSNIDFLRILLMSMIVLWHFYVHGTNVLSINEFQHSGAWKGIPLLLPLLCYHVDSFMIISGSFGIRFRIKKILLFFLQTFFYTSLAYVIHIYINNESPTPKVLITNLVMPYRMFWYAEIYFYMMLIGPLISMGLCAISKKTQIGILSIAFIFVVLLPFLSGIGNFRITMFFIYSLACYIQHNQVNILRKHSGKIFILCICFLFLARLFAIFLHNESLYNKSCSYGNPFTILAALSLFSFFSNMRKKIQFPFMKHIVPGLFATYLLTDSEYTRIINFYVIDFFGDNPILLFFIAFFFCILIGFLDTLRGKAFDKILCKCGLLVRKCNQYKGFVK